MNSLTFYPAGYTDALKYAIAYLLQHGCTITKQPDHTVTHLLLPVPAFEPDGSLKGGGDLTTILEQLPKNITVIGGNLRQDQLGDLSTIDLLQDPLYLAENAQITAHCAVKKALEQLPVTLEGCHILVAGWGRIGKCLAALLRQMGAIVTVAVRKESDRAILLALGYDALYLPNISYELLRYRVIFNTVPAPVLSKEVLQHCRPDCLKIDLASKRGMEGDDILWARGLPNLETPESSGKLIARSILRLC